MYHQHCPQRLAHCGHSTEVCWMYLWQRVNLTRQGSCHSVLKGGTNHIHCLNWKGPRVRVYLSCLPYLKIIPSSYLWFTEVHYSSYCGDKPWQPSNIAFHSLVEGITHLSTEDKVLLSNTSICRKTLKHEAVDEPFQWTFWFFEDGENSHMSLTL